MGYNTEGLNSREKALTVLMIFAGIVLVAIAAGGLVHLVLWIVAGVTSL